MSEEYLNKTGLSYFWSKIKAWCNAAFALIGHVHPSSDVTAMTGYSMPSASSAISASDSLNQAVGKLEKAISDADVSNVVHRTGNESVAGEKTFTGPLARADTVSGILIRNLNAVRGSVYEDRRYWHVVFLDASGAEYVSDGSHGRLGLLSMEIGTNSDIYKTRLMLFAYANVANSRDAASFQLGIDNNDIFYMQGPSTSENRTASTDILTRDWIPKDTRIVHTSGNETINGSKTFTSGVTCNNTYYVSMPAVSAGKFHEPIKIHDSDSKRCLLFRCFPSGVTSGTFAGDVVHNEMTALTDNNGAVWGGSFIFGRDSSGNAFCACTSTSASRTVGNDIITRDFLSGSNSNVVHRTGNETIAGNKTFTGATTAGDLSSSKFIATSSIGMCRTGNTGMCQLVGGAYGDSCASLNLNGGTRSSNPGFFHLYAATPTASSVLQGKPNGGLTWNGNTIQTTSDERLKTPLRSVPDDVLDAWLDVEWGQFQFLNAVAEKGADSARLHAGLVSQAVQRAFAARGLDACAYGILCYDFSEGADYDEEIVVREAYVDDQGVEHPAETAVEHVHEDAVDLWTVRYAEALCMEAACMRRENARLKKRVADLEERLAALELKVS